MELLNEEFPNSKVWIRKSGYDGAKNLYIESETADFEGYQESEGRNPAWLLNGALAGDEIEIVTKMSSIFKRFENVGLRITIEVYNSQKELFCVFPDQAKQNGAE